jgi:alanyl-tRNA synthetase
VDKTY